MSTFELNNTVSNNSELFKQISLESEYDILAEVILTTYYDVCCIKYQEETNCCICLESLKDTYCLIYPCVDRHTFHRNCILTYVLNEVKKSTLVTNCDRCPDYMELLQKQQIIQNINAP